MVGRVPKPPSLRSQRGLFASTLSLRSHEIAGTECEQQALVLQGMPVIQLDRLGGTSVKPTDHTLASLRSRLPEAFLLAHGKTSYFLALSGVRHPGKRRTISFSACSAVRQQSLRVARTFFCQRLYRGKRKIDAQSNRYRQLAIVLIALWTARRCNPSAPSAGFR